MKFSNGNKAFGSLLLFMLLLLLMLFGVCLCNEDGLLLLRLISLLMFDSVSLNVCSKYTAVDGTKRKAALLLVVTLSMTLLLSLPEEGFAEDDGCLLLLLLLLAEALEDLVRAVCGSVDAGTLLRWLLE